MSIESVAIKENLFKEKIYTIFCFVRNKYVHLYQNQKMEKIKNARFDTRLPEEQKLLFERAARLGGFRNLTDFVIVTLKERAKEIITESQQVIVSQNDNEIFFNALMNPDEPKDTLLSAAEDFNESIKK